MVQFYVVWVILAVIVAAAFTWLAFKPQPEPPILASRTNKPNRKPRTAQVHTVNHAVRDAPETPSNDEELLKWSGMQQTVASSKPTAKVEVAKPEAKKEVKEERTEHPDQAKAAELRKELEELLKKSKGFKPKDLAALHNKRSKDDIAKQERLNKKLEEFYNSKVNKLEAELKAVKSNQGVALASSRDSLNQRNYAKNTENVLQAKLDALNSHASFLESDNKAKEQEIQRLESGQDEASDELEAAIQLHETLQQENKELRARLSFSHRVSATSDDVKKLADALSNLQAELDNANKDLQALTTQHQATKAALVKAKADLASRASGEDLVESLTSQLAEIEKHNKSLAAAVQKERQRISTASTTLADKNKELKEKIAASTQEVEDLNQKIKQVQTELSA